MALDKLALDHPSRFCCGGIETGLDLPELARRCGSTLWQALPLSWMKIARRRRGAKPSCSAVANIQAITPPDASSAEFLSNWPLTRPFSPQRAERVFDLIAALLALARDGRADRPGRNAHHRRQQCLIRPSLDSDMQRIYRRAARAARSDINVLIRGESGEPAKS